MQNISTPDAGKNSCELLLPPYEYARAFITQNIGLKGKLGAASGVTKLLMNPCLSFFWEKVKEKSGLSSICLKLSFAALHLIFACTSTNVMAASFDCDKAVTRVEKRICSNSELSTLDERLYQDYQDAIHKENSDKDTPSRQQRHWLKFTRNKCKNISCLKRAYWSQLAALATVLDTGETSPDKTETEKGIEVMQLLNSVKLELRGNYPLIEENFCNEVISDIKSNNKITFIEPIVKTQSYEDPVLDPWKSSCTQYPAFLNLKQYGGEEWPLYVFAGTANFRIFELTSSSSKRYIFSYDHPYGPIDINQSLTKNSPPEKRLGFWEDVKYLEVSRKTCTVNRDGEQRSVLTNLDQMPLSGVNRLSSGIIRRGNFYYTY